MDETKERMLFEKAAALVCIDPDAFAKKDGEWHEQQYQSENLIITLCFLRSYKKGMAVGYFSLPDDQKEAYKLHITYEDEKVFEYHLDFDEEVEAMPKYGGIVACAGVFVRETDVLFTEGPWEELVIDTFSALTQDAQDFTLDIWKQKRLAFSDKQMFLNKVKPEKYYLRRLKDGVWYLEKRRDELLAEQKSRNPFMRFIKRASVMKEIESIQDLLINEKAQLDKVQSYLDELYISRYGPPKH